MNKLAILLQVGILLFACDYTHNPLGDIDRIASNNGAPARPGDGASGVSGFSVISPTNGSTPSGHAATFTGTCTPGATVSIYDGVVPSPTSGVCTSMGTFSIPVMYTPGPGPKVSRINEDLDGVVSSDIVMTVMIPLCTSAAIASPVSYTHLTLPTILLV